MRPTNTYIWTIRLIFFLAAAGFYGISFITTPAWLCFLPLNLSFFSCLCFSYVGFDDESSKITFDSLTNKMIEVAFLGALLAGIISGQIDLNRIMVEEKSFLDSAKKFLITFQDYFIWFYKIYIPLLPLCRFIADRRVYTEDATDDIF